MRLMITTFAVTGLAACSAPADNLARDAQNNYEAKAAMIENQALNTADPGRAAELEVKAQDYRQMGEGKAESIRESGIDPAVLNSQQRNEMTRAKE